MVRWKYAALVCAALGMSACESDAGQAAGDAPDAETAPPADDDSDPATEDDDEEVDEVPVPDADSDDVGPGAAAPTPQHDANTGQHDASTGEDAASMDAAPGLDAGADAASSASADAGDVIDAGGQVDSAQPDVQAPPVCTDTCSGHGSCTLQGGAPACLCDVGHGGATCNVCSNGYARDTSSGLCLPLGSVVEVRAVPPNGTCASGGHTLLEGIDSDLSGSLEPGEVTKEQVVCKMVRSGNVLVTNAAELESLRGITEITGSLTIKAPYVTTLEPLKRLISVGSYLTIEGSNALVDFKGLSWLDSVGGYMTIRSNAGLQSTEGMTALRLVTGSLLVERNPALKHLDLGPLQVVQVDVTVTTHAELVSFDGTRLRSVVGALKLLSNPKLETLGALGRLKAIGGTVDIKQCHGLTHLRGLGQLNDVGTLTLEDNDKLVDVSALAALRSVRGSLVLRSLPSLQIGLGDAQLATVNGYLAFYQLPLLPSLGSFTQLATIGGGLLVIKTGVEAIAPFPALNSFAPNVDPIVSGCAPPNPLDPTSSCPAFTETLVIGENPALRQFGGFPLRMNGQPQIISGAAFHDDPQLAQLENLPFTGVLSTLRLENLPALRALPWLGLLERAYSVLIQNTGLDRIELTRLATATTLKVSGNANATLLSLPLKPFLSTLDISSNAALTTLSLPTLTQLESLKVSDNRALVRLELPELTQLSYGTLARNAALTAFTSPKLARIGSLTLDDNAALTSLSALAFSPEQYGDLLRITNNAALQRLPSTGMGLFTTVEIVNNDALISLDRFTSATTRGSLLIEDNDALPSLAGLQATDLWHLVLIGNDALTSLASGATITATELEVRDHPALISLSGIGLGDSFSLINNDALPTLDGLVVGANASMSRLRLEGNAALFSLTGLDNLSSVTWTFSIQDNSALPQCAALAFSGRITGTTTRTIGGNNGGATCP
jgi:hypothetical protein